MPAPRLLERRPALVPLLIFAVTQAVGAVLLTIGASRQAAITGADAAYKLTTPTPESPGYLGVVANWDGQWFWSIARDGYPSSLPRAGGEVLPNEWAFTPGYPFLVRVVMAVTQLEFPAAAVLVSITCGAAAMVVLHGMVSARVDQRAATGLVLALCCFPSAPVFQVAYTESLALLLVVLALRALTDRRHGWFLLFAALLSVTRPVLLPLAAVAGIVWLLRWRRRSDVPFAPRERWVSGAAAVACAAMVGAWPAIAAVVTRDPGAFTDTMAAWPANKAMGGAGTNWLTLALDYPALLVLPVLPLLALALYAALRRPARALPPTWRWWGPTYIVYMLVATKPSAGILRYVLLAVFPLAPFLEVSNDDGDRTAARRALTAALVCTGLVGQYFWVTEIFTIDEAPVGQLFP